MDNIKKHTLAYLAALFLPLVGFAYDGCCSQNYAFGGEVKFLYLQPTANNLGYAAEAIPLPLPSPDWIIHDIRPDYHPAFEVSLNAQSCDSCFNGEVRYTRFHSEDSNSTNVGTENMVGPFFEIGPDAINYLTSKGKCTFDYNAIDLTLGYGFCLQDCFHANLFAGIGGVRIKEKVTSHFADASGLITRKITTPISFTGIGPELGMDFSYAFCGNFQLVGSTTAALLVGNIKNHTNYVSNIPEVDAEGIPMPNEQSTKGHKKTQVVPAFEGKLGIAYNFCLCDWNVGIDAGYEVRYYINALQSTDISSEVITPPDVPDKVGVFARTFKHTLSDFALAGPYVALNIEF